MTYRYEYATNTKCNHKHVTQSSKIT